MISHAREYRDIISAFSKGSLEFSPFMFHTVRQLLPTRKTVGHNKHTKLLVRLLYGDTSFKHYFVYCLFDSNCFLDIIDFAISVFSRYCILKLSYFAL